VEPDRSIPGRVWALCLLTPPLIAVGFGGHELITAVPDGMDSTVAPISIVVGPLLVAIGSIVYAIFTRVPWYDRLFLVGATLGVVALSVCVGLAAVVRAWAIECDGRYECPF
jgi:hypothetical protein